MKDRHGVEDDMVVLSLSDVINDNLASQNKERTTEGGGGCWQWRGELISLISDMLSLRCLLGGRCSAS